MTNRIKRPSRKAIQALLKKHTECKGTSSFSQRQLIRKYFQGLCTQLTVQEGRELLGIMHPSGRIHELRRQGYKIALHWVTELDSLGREHRNGLYVYMGTKGAK
jgi:hypothetical protein